MAGTQTKWDRVRQEWQDEGIQGLALWAVDWTLWKTRFYYALSGPQAEDLQARIRYAHRVKKYGIDNPIIVYQMGKVGSTTMVRSLQALRLNVPIYHLHFLNEADQIEAWAKKTLLDPTYVLQMVKQSRDVRKTLDRADAPRYNLISMVRAPVPRNISMMFQNADSYFPGWESRYHAGTLPFDEITEFFLKEFQEETPNFWFEREVRDVFGLDVYATPFDKARGYQIYENARARMLVMRLEDLNRVAPAALCEFLRIPDFQMVSANIGESNPHGGLYKEYLNALRLPDEFIDQTHAKHYARHFYTPEELEASVARWRSAKGAV